MSLLLKIIRFINFNSKIYENVWQWFSNLGTEFCTSDQDKRRLILANRINVVFMFLLLCVIIFIIITGKGLEAYNVYLAFTATIINLILSKNGFLKLFKFSVCVSALFLLLFYLIISGITVNRPYFWYVYMVICFSIVPHMIFSFKTEKISYFITVLYFLILVIFTERFLILSVKEPPSVWPIFKEDFLLLKAIQIFIYIFLNIGFLYYKRLNEKNENSLIESARIIKEQAEELIASNEELNNLNEDLNYLNDQLEKHRNQLEDLVDMRTNELKISESRFRNLFENMLDSFTVFKLIDENNHTFDFEIVDMNPVAEKVIGTSKPELIGKKLLEVFPFHDKKILEIYRNTALTGESFQFEYYSENVFKRHFYFSIFSPEKGYIALISKDITDRKLAEEKLKASEEKYSRIVNTASEGIVVVNNDIVITYVNTQLTKMVGYEQEEMIGKPFANFIKRQEIQILDELVENRKKGIPDKAERSLLRKDGTEIWVLVSATPIIDPVQGFQGSFSMLTDITTRKKAEESLKKSEEQFRLVIENMPILLNAFDEKGNIIAWNKACEEVTGYKANEIIGNPDAMKLLYPKPEYLKEVWNASLDDEIKDKAFELIAKNGEIRTIQWFDIYHHLTIPGWNSWGMGQDITERKKIENALKESEEKFAKSFQSAPILISITDVATGKYLDVNEEAIQVSGFSRDEIMNHTSIEIGWITPANRTRLLQELQTKGRIVDMEMDFRAKDGHAIIGLVSGELLSFAGRNGLLTVTVDITNRKKAEEELRKAKETLEIRVNERTAELKVAKENLEGINEVLKATIEELASTNLELQNAIIKAEIANKAKNTFLANMSHELRTPLNAILGYAQILRLEKDMTESQLKGIKTVQRSGEHLLHMIEEILDIAKIEAQKVDLQPIDFRLSDLLEDIFEMIRIKAEQKELTISKDFAPDIPIAIFADDKRMRQILLNFLNNAVKFTKHGQIIFRVLSDNKIDPKISKLRFEVEDTGVGIPEDKVDKIFEPFYQLGELKDRAEGTGLGLAISKSIVQIMGGELYISSTPDKGTLIGFKADFPISTVALSSRESILERRIIGIKGKPPKCLIADDNADNLQILMDVLKPIGFKIEIALNGNEAVKKASMFLPNIIFMDILMPEMDGYQAANAIRKLKKLKDVIIIAVSASVGILSEHKKVELGFDGFLLKPIQLELIFDLLQEKLKLDWIIEQPKTIQEINDIENIIFPSDPLLKELILAAKHHDLTALDEWLEKTVQIETIYIPFVAKVKTLISKYQFKQIISLCETANK